MGAPEWDGAPHRAGAGLLVELPLQVGGLDLELASAFLTGEGGPEIPLDMLLKTSVGLRADLDLFAGLGPMVAWLPGHGVGGGLIASLGLHQWVAPTWGLLLEADYTVFGEGPVTGHALELAAGVVWRP